MVSHGCIWKLICLGFYLWLNWRYELIFEVSKYGQERIYLQNERKGIENIKIYTHFRFPCFGKTSRHACNVSIRKKGSGWILFSMLSSLAIEPSLEPKKACWIPYEEEALPPRHLPSRRCLRVSKTELPFFCFSSLIARRICCIFPIPSLFVDRIPPLLNIFLQNKHKKSLMDQFHSTDLQFQFLWQY